MIEPLAEEYRDIETRRVGESDLSDRNCVRCGDRHDRLEVVAFWQPILDEDDGFAYRWWAPCPTTGDPILMRDLKEPRPDGAD